MLKNMRYFTIAITAAPAFALAPAAIAAPGAPPPLPAAALPQPAAPAPVTTATPAGPAPEAPVNPGTQNDGYVLGPGDVIEIAVLGREEFHPRVQVQVDGTIQLPYLHSVKAADMTVIQLRDKVARMLKEGGFYADPVVSLTVVSYASRYVTVLGEFGNPGIVPVDRAYRVSEILARVGGTRPTAADEIILRRADGQEFHLPVTEVARGGPDKDPFVQPGDKLYLAAAPNYYIYGQVGAPGAYKIEKGMTVRMALARGGGIKDRGSLGKVSVYRKGQKIKATMDMLLTPDDTIYVGERFF
jgi:polysaccharide export outer membrane protein